jgi:metal-dependent amidase/aminoacylase/carboxypeptidase family protein
VNLVELREKVSKEIDEAVSMRRYLHQHPELSGAEENTRAYIDGRCLSGTDQ